MAKIQALQSEWLSKDFSKKVLPLLLENKVPVAKEKTLLLTDVYSDDYFAKMRIAPPDIAVLDHRHWHYPDSVFHDYISRVASFDLPVLCLGESPFGFEMPNVGLFCFEEKLYKRTKMAADSLRMNSPKTTLVSPAISIVDPKLQENYLDFFIHNRRCFDVYAVHCVYDMKEQITGLLTAFLNQVLKTLQKPVWVTKWAVPACDHPVISDMSMTSLDWTPTPQSQANQHLRAGFKAIEEVAGSDTKWFYTGLDKDDYRPTANIPNMWDGYQYKSHPCWETVWNARHFTGAMDHRSQVKTAVLEALFSLV